MNKFVKVLAMLMALMLCVTLTACAGKQGNGDAAVNYSLGLTTDGRYDAINLKDYVTLGQYTGIQYDESTLTVKEQDIQKKVDSIMCSHTYKEDVTDRAVEEANLRKAMFGSCKKKILLCDSSKFGKKALLKLEDMRREFSYITDGGLSAELKNLYAENGLRIYNNPDDLTGNGWGGTWNE